MPLQTDKLSSEVYRNMGKIFRFILAFISGTACYAIGFVLGGFLMDLANSFILMVPPQVALGEASLTATALAANCLGLYVFSLIDKSRIGSIVFSSWLIIIAAVYAVLCFVYGSIDLLWYPIVSFVLCGATLHRGLQGKPILNEKKSSEKKVTTEKDEETGK